MIAAALVTHLLPHLGFSPLTPLVMAAALATSPLPPDAELRTLGEGMRFVEGPVWVAAENALVFSDIPRSMLMRWTAADGVTDWIEVEGSNGNVLDGQGHLLSCQQGARNVVRRDARSGALLEILAHEASGKKLNSPNDLAVHSTGNLWFTDPPWGLPGQREGKEQSGHYAYFHDAKSGQTSARLKQFCMPNGIALSPDERTLYLSDTGGHPSHPDESFHHLPATVHAFALDARGDLANPAPLWRLTTLSDGMCVDTFGRLYLTGPPGVTIWSPQAKRLAEIPVPHTTTNVCLGGPKGQTLFITAGPALYAIDLAARGRPTEE